MRFRGSGRNNATRINQGCPEGPGDGETLRGGASSGEGCDVDARDSTEVRESVPGWVAMTNASKRPPVTAKDTPAMRREAIGITRPSDNRSHLAARAVSMPRSEPDPLQISSLPTAHDLDSAWSGLAVVVGTGGIGSAVATALKERCRDLTVLRCGRPGSQGNDLSLDLDNPSSFADFRAALQADGRPLRLVFNCTGRLHGPNLVPEKRLSQIDRSALLEQFSINAIGPVLLAQAIEPLLQRDRPFHFASLSARVGSIGDNRSGGWYGYRAAKAAQNQLLRCLSIEWSRRWPQATVTLLHPGTTDTELSKPFQSFVPPEKLFSPKRAADQLLTVLLKQTPSDSGAFLAWDGQSIAW